MRRTFALALSFAPRSLPPSPLPRPSRQAPAPINGKVTDASDAVMPGVTVTLTSPSADGRAHGGHRCRRHLSLHRGHARRLRGRVRAGRILDGPQRRHPRQPRLHRHGERGAEGRVAAGIGHGDRPVAGGRHLGDVDRQHLRRQAAVGAADLARLLLAAGAVAGGADDAHRRRRQHQRHAAGLRRLRHDRPGPRDLRGHQRHREHRRVRQLPRRRRHGGSADEHRRALGRGVDAGRADAVHQQVGRQPVPRHVLRRLLARELAGVQHRRRSDRARPDGRRRPRSRGRESAQQLPGHERRPRRLRDQGSPVVVRLVPPPGHQGAVRQLPGHAADRPSSTTTAPRSPTT